MIPKESFTTHQPPDRFLLPDGADLRILSEGTVIGRFQRMDIASVFQPIVEAESGLCVGNEAFVRAHGRGDLSLSPWGLFSLADEGRALVTLDRLCRIVHVLNYIRALPEDGLLFMNVHGRLLEAVAEDHGSTYRRMLDQLGFPPERIVIEIPHTANDNRSLLALALANYRRNGFSVAINAACGGSVAAALLGVVHADYLKIDSRSTTEPEIMAAVADLALDRGVTPIFTRVESSEQRDFLSTLDGVWQQGRAIASPQVLPAGPYQSFLGEAA